jgi:hypothetical protein
VADRRPSRRAALLGLAGLAGGLIGCDRTPRPRVPPTATPSPYIGPDLASQLVGQDTRVRMKVVCADFPARGGPTYLRPTCFYEGYFFRLVIPWEQREIFFQAVGGPPELQLVDRVIDARGVVQANGNWSEIVIQSTDQLKIATGWRPPPVPTALPTRLPSPTAASP